MIAREHPLGAVGEYTPSRGGQVDFVALFALKWRPRAPKLAFCALALRAAAGLATLAPMSTSSSNRDGEGSLKPAAAAVVLGARPGPGRLARPDYRCRRPAPQGVCRLITSVAAGLLSLLAAAAALDAESAQGAARFQLQSNAWVNLHQRLVHEARFGSAAPPALAGADLATWKKSVEAYRAYLGKRSPIFDAELIALNATLSKASSFELPAPLPAPAAAALAAAMPLYRAAQWDEDDRANRFWIAVAEPLLASAGEELAEAHARAYGVPFPTDVLVDVSPLAWEFGAYTVGEGRHAHAVISSTNGGTQGFAALESLMHEASHAIVGTDSGAIGADLTRAAAELGVKPPWNLWHAILFYTSSELTRRALAARGVGDYRPIVLGMYERGFAPYRSALETHWQAYLDGKIPRESAIRQVLSETAGRR